ncbi:DNA polymerase I [Lentimicrobium sp. S6]|uniref:DNA polymerase I n=1 Tax=Lentimicrobium sp. S6 TaxID=2735872 RepID=UPI001553CAF0|nr:DNA polymerase I [Lentimicrobium sp. S6]NPD44093.1 DNA polymerase I [Lentimicrobium sp. S6]
MPTPKRLYLLDAYALIYRAYYALNRNPRINSKGLNTSAILGFANTLLEVIQNEKPDYMAVVFDPKGLTFRSDFFPEYKANREKTPEDITAAIPYIKSLIDGMGVERIEVEKFEADDVIGTLSKKAEKAGLHTFMMTPDKDYGQLVSENIFMVKPAKSGNPAQVLGPKEICENFGVKRPEQVIDFLGMSGDSVDNIPGIAGVGPVTARKLIAQFDSVENMVAHVDEIKNPKLKIKVADAIEAVLISKRLATIELNVPVELELDKLLLDEPKREELNDLFNELEFRTFAKRVFGETASPIAAAPSAGMQTDLFGGAEEVVEEFATTLKTIDDIEHKYEVADTPQKRANLIETLNSAMAFCFDTETTGLDSLTDELVGMSFSFNPHTGVYVPLPNDLEEANKIVNEFKSVFESDKIGKIGQNLKFDIAFLASYGIDVQGQLFDTMIAHYLLQPDMRHNMDLLSETYLNYKPMSIESLIGKKGKNQRSMRDVDMETITKYAAEDADITLQLKMHFEPLLAEKNLLELFAKVEMPLIKVLAEMERNGVKLDVSALGKFSEELAIGIRALETQIHEHAGESFNIASPKQLGDILFGKMMLSEKAKKTKTGQYSTGEEILVKLEGKHPIIRDILDYRSLTKLKSTYVDALPELVNKNDGRIHTSYNQTVAATGRLSSTNPNLQNIPIRTPKGKEIRRAFVPQDEEHILFAADYSQVELRIIASMSGDEAMIHDFNEGIDIHTATASRVYDVPLEEVTSDIRRNAKTVNFGIIYGISAFGLSERLGIPRKESATIIKNYFEKYSGIKSFMDSTVAFAKEKGYVETLMGRRRYLKDITSRNAIVRGFAERNAINAPIQGSSADMIKVAMIRIYEAMQKAGLKSKMILQVHDELVFDALKEELPTLQVIVEREMREALKLKVPVVVDMNTGENWLDAH